jgi:hypothetical protein
MVEAVMAPIPSSFEALLFLVQKRQVFELDLIYKDQKFGGG